MRRDTADRLYEIVCHRFAKEKPNYNLCTWERDAIWHTIYRALCRGKTEEELKEWCNTVNKLTSYFFY